MKARATLFATVALVGLSACKDSGLPDRNLPIEDAEHRAPDALVQAVHPESRPEAEGADAHGGLSMATRPVTIGDQTFAASGMPATMDASGLTQVGTVGGMGFFAARGDGAPYDVLYMAHGESGYVAYTPVHDDGDPSARQEALQQALENGGGAAH